MIVCSCKVFSDLEARAAVATADPPTHGRCGEAEFLALAEELGIDPGAMVDPRTELSFAIARRDCGKCISKEKCRQALCQRVVRLSEIAPFCPSAEVLVELLRRQPYGRAEKSPSIKTGGPVRTYREDASDAGHRNC